MFNLKLLRHLTGFSRRHGRTSKAVLERSFSTNLQEISPPETGWFLRKFPLAYHIVTLDPNKFAEKKQRRLYLSGIQQFTPHVALEHPIPVITPSMHYYREPTTNKKKVMVPYPTDTRAFLYYSMSPEKPRIAGELRLRVTSSCDPVSFESGSDLLRPDGRPWSRPLFSLSKYYLSLYERLREDGLIPDDLHTALATLPSKRYRYHRSNVLYTLNDTFTVDFSSSGTFFFLITEQGVKSLALFKLFSVRHENRDPRPFTGSALARFERSTLPEHVGTRTIVLRFLKIITPVKCVMPLDDGYLCCPKEGELLRKVLKDNQQVWSLNIDKSVNKQSFQLLWDA